MAQQLIDLSSPNDGEGDRLRDALEKVQANLIELYALPAVIAVLQMTLTQKQPLDDDLSAIALLTTTSYGRSFLQQVDAPAARTLLALGTAAVLSAGAPGGAATLDPSTGKLVSTQIPDVLLGAITYKGTWNAGNNTPTLPTPAPANNGWYYIVQVAGQTSLPGINGVPISDWQIGDWAVSNGVFWEKVDSSDQVVSVAGLQGIITAASLTANLVSFGGDTGAGGLQGLVPAPAPGDAAASKLLRADGTWGFGPVNSQVYSQALALSAFGGNTFGY